MRIEVSLSIFAEQLRSELYYVAQILERYYNNTNTNSTATNLKHEASMKYNTSEP